MSNSANMMSSTFTYADAKGESHKLTVSDKEVVVSFNPEDPSVLGLLVDDQDSEDTTEKGFYIDSINKCSQAPLAINLDIGFTHFGIHPNKKKKAFEVLEKLRIDKALNYMPAIIDNHAKKGGIRYYVPGQATIQLNEKSTESDIKGFFNAHQLLPMKKYNATPNYYIVKLPEVKESEPELLFNSLAIFKDQKLASDVKMFDGLRVGFHEGLMVWPATPPNDPSYSSQWGLNETIYNKDADVNSAWTKSTGVSQVVMAFLDTGIDVTHADLNTFSGRIINAYNCVTGTTDVTDSDGHGTNVASVAAAGTNNAIGIAGVAPGCKITPVKVFNNVSTTVYADKVEGINHVKNLASTSPTNANRYVMNISWKNSGYDDAIDQAIENAYNANVVIVCAAWEDNSNLNTTNVYPSCYCNSTPQWVLAVGAHVKSGGRKSPSNYSNSGANGGKVIFAPGDQIHTYNPGSTVPVLKNGTSLAAAFVTGTAAIIWSRDYTNGGAGFSLSKSQVRDRVMNFLKNTTISFGKGRVDANSAANF